MRTEPKKCRPSKLAMMFPRTAWFHFFYGIESRIPICCVVAFCFRHILGIRNHCKPPHYAQFAHCWIHRITEHRKPAHREWTWEKAAEESRQQLDALTDQQIELLRQHYAVIPSMMEAK